MRPEIALSNAGVLVDVVGIGYDDYTPQQRDQVVDHDHTFRKPKACTRIRNTPWQS